jgi:hypothetical protein
MNIREYGAMNQKHYPQKNRLGHQQMNQLKYHFFMAFIVLVCLLLPQSYASPIDIGNIDLNLSLNAQKISLNEPVLIDLILTNRGIIPITVELTQHSITGIEFSIKVPGGQSFQRYKFTPPWGVSSIRKVKLAPGASYHDALIVDKWHAFNSPGLYEIKPHLIVPLNTYERLIRNTNGNSQLNFNANQVMQLTITPRDEKRLKQRADELLALTLSDKRFQLADAAERLSFLNDAVAIDAFECLLSKTSSWRQHYATNGLARIADLQSTRVLIKYQAKSASKGDYFITHALRRISEKSGDAQIAAMAKAAAEKYPYKSSTLNFKAKGAKGF